MNVLLVFLKNFISSKISLSIFFKIEQQNQEIEALKDKCAQYQKQSRDKEAEANKHMQEAIQTIADAKSTAIELNKYKAAVRFVLLSIANFLASGERQED